MTFYEVFLYKYFTYLRLLSLFYDISMKDTYPYMSYVVC